MTEQKVIESALIQYEHAIENYGYFKDKLNMEERYAVKKALEKQIVKHPHTCNSYCPTCGTIVLGTGNPLKKYCEFCGQRLYE